MTRTVGGSFGSTSVSEKFVGDCWCFLDRAGDSRRGGVVDLGTGGLESIKITGGLKSVLLYFWDWPSDLLILVLAGDVDSLAMVQGLVFGAGFGVVAVLVLVFVFAVVDFEMEASVLARVDDLLDLAVLPEVFSFSRADARCTGGNWLACLLLTDALEGPASSFSVPGFETFTNRSMAPFVIPPFVTAFLVANFALMNFLGSRRDSS